MKFVQTMCIALLIVQTAAQFACAQESTATSPQTSSAPAANEKQRSARETRERLEQLACGPKGVHLAHHTEKNPQPLPEHPPDKGLIYVIRNGSLFGAAIQAKFAMDGKWVGVNRVSNYFYFEASPGPHYFCADANGRGLLSLVIEKGTTYYLQQRLTMGGTDLDLINAEKGQAYVAKYHRSIFEEKHKN
ncbi:MAG: hypothetical protein AUI53_06395 [Acidobacteria bacterium 13_1_40CM_2_60_7]|nr:MAG: hypothetical protein AUI53_06395 [Acidobacteria bacterium 13_1_40CM_2_60_7]